MKLIVGTMRFHVDSPCSRFFAYCNSLVSGTVNREINLQPASSRQSTRTSANTVISVSSPRRGGFY